MSVVSGVTDHLVRVGRETRHMVVKRGGDFMRSEQMQLRERELGVSPNTLYFRGRTAALGDITPVVASEIFGIFPEWYVKSALRGTRKISRDTATENYLSVCWEWGRANLSEVASVGRAAELLFEVADTTDASALPLFAGWRAAKRPSHDAEALAHALMVVRELRGGLHFAALRAFGVGTREAIMVDRVDGGIARLARSGWMSQDIEQLEARTMRIPDLQQRWDQAEEQTNCLFGSAVSSALTEGDAQELHEMLVRMSA
ncbi:hypothetical protein [Streptomyces sp. NPDC091217]|uniref:SCO6745 family protein n=1 Tax=Streptomyces sp. NPDC091217 TaxID=3365975 RepID=UPI0037F547FD